MLENGACIPRIFGVALALLLFSAAPLAAQTPPPVTCIVLSVPTQLRAEGLTELVGDIILTCSGGAPTQAGKPIPQANFAVFLNTSATSRILGSNGASEALLLIDEPGSPTNPVQKLCPGIAGCVVSGNGGSGEPFNGSDANHPNVFQGVVTSNSVTFQGVPVEAPGAGSRIYRITNIRADAVTVAGNLSAQVLASVSVSGPVSLPLNNPLQIVGSVMSGLAFSNGTSYAPQCAPLTDSATATYVQFAENFSSAFRTRTSAGADPAGIALQATPGVDYNSESGLVFPGLPGSGLANFGTRFKAVIQNVPPGVTVWVQTTSNGASNTSAAQMTLTETGPYYPVAGANTVQGYSVVQVPVVNGAATVFFEVIAASPAVIDSYFFAVFFDSTAAPGPAAPSITVNESFAPTESAFPSGDPTQAQSSAFAIPRFHDPSTPGTLISLVPCQTLLLFPYVVNQGPFDTGMAISNTSSDPVATPLQSGTCTLTPYGTNAPDPVVTSTVAAGTVYSLLASASFPGFAGYVLALCDFQYAHGFAFISDLGARNLAMGYLPLVITGGADINRSGAPPAESASH